MWLVIQEHEVASRLVTLAVASHLVLFGLVPSGVLRAQAAPPTVTFSGSGVMDGGRMRSLAFGSLCVMTTDANDKPMGYRIGNGNGQTSASVSQASCATVTGGTFPSMQIINSAASSPPNACIRVTTFDASGGELRRSKCVQTGTSDALSSWCSLSGSSQICDWSRYPGDALPQAMLERGPAGPQGPSGCVVGQTCTSALAPRSIAGVLYAAGFGVTCDGTADDTSALQAAGSTATATTPARGLQ